MQPGERLEKGIQDVYVLSEDEGLILRCIETFEENGKKKVPGDRWMIKGYYNDIFIKGLKDIFIIYTKSQGARIKKIDEN